MTGLKHTLLATVVAGLIAVVPGAALAQGTGTAMNEKSDTHHAATHHATHHAMRHHRKHHRMHHKRHHKMHKMHGDGHMKARTDTTKAKGGKK